MNIKTLIAASLVTFAGSAAMAQEITVFHDPVGSSVSRAQVKSDLAKAEANGTAFQDGEGVMGSIAPQPSTVSRDQVRAQARQAEMNGSSRINESYQGNGRVTR
jgi:hypothetical protein